jgi:hypothetical protein
MQSGKYSQEFLSKIKLKFKFLFERHGFVPKVCVEAREGEYCLVILASDRCQIKFRLEKGTPEYFFGTLNAPPVWEDKPGWYAGDAIVAYLFTTKPELAIPWLKEKNEWGTEETLQMFSVRLEPVAADIISAFAANLNVDWWKSYQADRSERIQKIKAQLARGEKVLP